MSDQTGNAMQQYVRAQQANLHKLSELDSGGKAPLKTYTCNMQAAGFVFSAGKRAQFLPNSEGANCYTTDIPSEQVELDREITLGHPNISVYAGDVRPLIEPMEVLRERFYKQFQADQARALNPDNNAGTTAPVKLNVANSRTISAGASGSNSDAAVVTK